MDRDFDAPGTASGQASILNLVKQVQYRAYVRLEALFHPLGLTAVQFRILMTLSARPAVTSAELARLYDVKPQTMNKQIALLEAKGCIARETSQTNRRFIELRLSADGAQCLARCQAAAHALEAEILSPLAAEEQAALRAYLDRLNRALAPGAAVEIPAEDFSQELRRAGVQRDS